MTISSAVGDHRAERDSAETMIAGEPVSETTTAPTASSLIASWAPEGDQETKAAAKSRIFVSCPSATRATQAPPVALLPAKASRSLWGDQRSCAPPTPPDVTLRRPVPCSSVT